MTDTIRNFIDGELVESAATDFIDLVDPVTGRARRPFARLDPRGGRPGVRRRVRASSPGSG